MKHRWEFSDYDYRCANCRERRLGAPVAGDWEGCDPGWIPIKARIIRTVKAAASWHEENIENLNRHGTITGYEHHSALTYYTIMFDGDEETTRYVTGHLGIVPLSVVDLLAELGREVRAMSALERGLRDGLRLQNNEVSVDQLCAELADDPP